MKHDMNLSEFIRISDARPVADSEDWVVTIVLKNGKLSNLTVSKCYSEFEAKERVYLYLVDRILNKTS